MAEGYIVAQIFTSRGVIPIMDASVSVTQERDNKSVLIGFRKTNEYGRTAPIAIRTPEKELSLSPGYETPFTACDIQIEHPSYYTVFIKDVQIFANVISVQTAQLIPIEAGADNKNAVENFQALPQNL